MYNFIYSSSDIYAPFCLASVSSLLKNNKEINGQSTLHLLSNAISDSNIAKFKLICDRYGCNFNVIDTKKVKELIRDRNCKLNFNISSFLRIFLSELLPKDVNKALFIDSDTYINSGIAELYSLSLDNVACAMVPDQPILRGHQAEAGLKYNENYFNAGVILVNVRYWRDYKISDKMLESYLCRPNGCSLDDQTVINAVLARNTIVLPYKYNMMKCISCRTYRAFCKSNQPIGYHTYEEFIEARNKPVIIHFNGPSLRPWHKWNAHPYKKKFLQEVREYTPEFKLIKPEIPLYFLLFSWCVNKFGYKIIYAFNGHKR